MPSTRSDGFNYGTALTKLVKGKRVARSGWNGKNMFIFHVTGWGCNQSSDHGLGSVPHLPFIAMKTAADEVVPWLASQSDMLAEDWVTV